MEFCCTAPFAVVGLLVWTSLFAKKRISGKVYWSAFASVAAIGSLLFGWFLYYGLVVEGLVMAAGQGDSPQVETLIRYGADPNENVEEFGYPIVAAVENGHADAVRVLLKHGANPNVHNENNSRSLVRLAADEKRWDIVTLLKDAGGKA